MLLPNLKEKCEGDPLIESVLHSFLLILKNRSNPRVSHVPPNLTVHVLGEGECGVDPAVGVHHPTRNSLKSPCLTPISSSTIELTSTMQSMGSPKNCPMETTIQQAKMRKAEALQWRRNTVLSIHICAKLSLLLP